MSTGIKAKNHLARTLEHVAVLVRTVLEHGLGSERLAFGEQGLQNKKVRTQ